MKIRFAAVAVIVALGGVALSSPGDAAGRRALVVCKHGCRYRTIQSAVDHVRRAKRSIVRVKSGHYHEGVQLFGHRYDGLTIAGSAKSPRKVVLDGRNAHLRGKRAELAQNGIEAVNVDGLKVRRIWVRRFPSNGVFIRSDPGDHCHGFRLRRDLASYNGAYGLYALHCTGGRIVRSAGWGQGDSAFYIGATPPQDHPAWTWIHHDTAYENVRGFSGTNSKYVDIRHSMFFNNGVGVVANTSNGELFPPTGHARIRDNYIFWNNFNYFLPDSPVEAAPQRVERGSSSAAAAVPTGVGVLIVGGDGWRVKRNRIFGNFFWGAAAVSNPLDRTGQAISEDNLFAVNAMGRGGTDTNRFDLFSDGSGSGNCFAANISSTFDIAPDATHPAEFLYPRCPAPPDAGTGTIYGDGGQVHELASYLFSDPPCSQEDQWARHPHPDFRGYTPIDTRDLGPCR